MIHLDHTYGDERVKSDISDLVDQIRFPRTAEPKKEVPEVVADLVQAFQRLNACEHHRGDWMPC